MKKQFWFIIFILIIMYISSSLIGCKDFFSSVFGDRRNISNLQYEKDTFVVGFGNHIAWDYSGYIPEVDIELYLTREEAEAGNKPFKILANQYEHNSDNSFIDDDDNIHYYFFWDSMDLVFEKDENGKPYYENLFGDKDEKKIYIKVVDSDYPAIYDISDAITIIKEPHFRFFHYDLPDIIGEGSITTAKLIPHDQFGQRVKPNESDGVVTSLDLNVNLKYDERLPQEGQIVPGYESHTLKYVSESDRENCYIPENEDFVECNIEFGVDITSDTDLQIIKDNKVILKVTYNDNFDETIWLDIKDFSIETEPKIDSFNLYTDINDSYELWDESGTTFEIDEYTSFNIKVEAIDSYDCISSNFDYAQWTTDNHPLTVAGDHPFTLHSVSNDMVSAEFNLSLDQPGNNIIMSFQFTDEEGDFHDYQSNPIDVNDVSPPSGSIEINHGNEYINQIGVIVTITASDYSSDIEYRLSETESGLSSVSWSDYNPHSPDVDFTFDEPDSIGEFNKTVYAQFRDDLENETSGEISDSIIMDYGIVFVSKDHTGTGSNSGTRSNPFYNIDTALTMVNSPDFVKDTLTPEIRVAKTTTSYTEQLLLNNSVNLLGGYDYDGDITWTRDEGDLENNLTSLSFDDTTSTHGYTVKIMSDSTIDGFDISGSGNQNYFSVIYVDDNNDSFITHNKIRGNSLNTPDSAYGIYNIGAMTTINYNYEITAGKADNYSYGIYNNNSEPKIDNNELIRSDISDYGSYGIYNDSSNTQIRNNTEIMGGETNESGSVSAGIYNENSQGLIENNTSIKGAIYQTNESYGIYNISSSPMVYNNMIISGEVNAFSNQISYGIYIEDKNTDYPIIKNNTIISGGTSTDNGNQAAGIFVTSLGGTSEVSNRLIIDNNLIKCEDSYRSYGIGITSGSNYTMVRNNKIIVHGGIDTEKAGGIYVYSSYSCRFYNNAIYNDSNSNQANVGMEFASMNSSFSEQQFIAINNTILYINDSTNFIGILMSGNLYTSPDETIDVINNIIQSYNIPAYIGIYIDTDNALKDSSKIMNNDFYNLNVVLKDLNNEFTSVSGLNGTSSYDVEDNIPDNPQFLDINGADGSISYIADNDLHPLNLSVYNGGDLVDLGIYSDYPVDADDMDDDGDTSELVDIEGAERTDPLSIGAYEYDN